MHGAGIRPRSDRRGAVVVGCVLGFALWWACPVAAGPAPWVSDAGFLNTNAESDSGNDFEPRIAMDGAGTAIVVWYSGEDLGGRIGSDYDILFARSTDRGVSWTEPQPLNDNADTDSGSDWYPRVATDGSGTWVAVWQSLDDLGGTIGTDRDVLVARSTDGGVTWSAPAPLNTNAATDSGGDWNPSLVTDGAGTWLAVWFSNDPLGGSVGIDADVFLARSIDGGLSWSDPQPLNTNAGTDSGGDYYPRVATDGRGSWIAAWYSTDDLDGTLGADRDILVARSADGGVTWSAPRPLNTNADRDTGADAYAVLAADRSGTWVAAWQSVDPLEDTIGHDGDILFARSTDGGASWTDPEPLNTNAATDTGGDGGPQLAVDAAGHWLAVWSSDEPVAGVGTDADVLRSVSVDGGATWSDPAPLNSGASSDVGADVFVHLAVDPDGDWLAVWQSNEPIGSEVGTDLDVLVARLGFCTIRVAGSAATTIRFAPGFPPVEFDLVAGNLSDLRADAGFGRATCLGIFSANPAVDELPDPPVNEGRYYLARGRNSCQDRGYGETGLAPDPRDDLDRAGPCP